MKKNLLSRKAGTFLLAALAFLAAASPSRGVELAQNPNVRLNFTFQHTELKKILQEVEKQSDYYFVYNHDQIDVDRKISIRVENETIQKVLQMLFEGTQTRYEISGRQIALSPATHVRPGERQESGRSEENQPPVVNSGGQPQAQVPAGQDSGERRVVTGRVQDINGQPLVGASVYTGDMGIGGATDAEGRFSLRVPRSAARLTFSMVGYERAEVVIPASNTMVVILKDELMKMSEVLVTGYQTLSQERATGSFGTAPKDILNNRPDGDVLPKLEGAIPGLYYHKGGYAIRGIATLYGSKEPLYVIDGYPATGLGTLTPRDIANVTVLKDAAAASIYGVKGANGVIVITTHRGKTGGKMRIHVSSTLTIDPIPDYSQLNTMNSREMVDYQKTLFELGNAYYSPNEKLKIPQAVDALYSHKMGRMDDAELAATLERLRGYNNQQQVKENLMRSALTQQHSLSVGGGTESHRYYVSMNYKGSRNMAKGSTGNDVTVLFKEEVDLAKWITIDGTISAMLGDGKSDGNSYGSYVGYYAMPYDMLIDENGELAKMYQFKSEAEVERLVELGLYDESSNPITERKKRESKSNSLYLRLQGGVTFKPMEGLGINVSYQTERTSSHSKTFSHPDSYAAKKIQNDATQIIDGEIIRNVPYGGIMTESRSGIRNYTFRVQANFDRTFGGRHFVSALAGAERRSEVIATTGFYKLAYDDSRNLYEMLDVKALAAGLKGTESVYGTFEHNDVSGNGIYDKEDRYVSFYGNAGYTYDNRYTATVSARVDDTNLFGSDPKYRYLPMWSAGLKWNITNEKFMPSTTWLNHLAFRVTYGITGNVYRGSGPFLIAHSALNGETGIIGVEVSTPPNRSLRWEKTAVFNVGLDMAMLNDRISATIEFYNRNTTDLLATTVGDPTNKFTSIMKNFGNLYNRGFELGLNTLTVKAGDFLWRTTFNYSYNFNKVVKGNEGNPTVLAYTNNEGVMIEGKPRDALFSFRWAGLNPEYGTIRVYNKDGEVVENLDSQNRAKGMLPADDIESLVYSGTTRPKWTVGFINTFSWRMLRLTVHIVANGGHVIQDPLPNILNAGSMERNADKRAINFWRGPGDENKKGVMPAPVFTGGDSQYLAMWYAADRHIMPGDFLKVRNITLNCELPHKWMGRTIFSSAQLTFQVRDAICWVRNRENIDPETLISSPSGLPTRTTNTPRYTIGLDLTF